MRADRRGFTLIEMLVAIVMLVIGVLVLSGTATGISRMLGSGQGKTRVSAIASARLEYLRNEAAATNPPCTSAALVNGSAAQPLGFTEQWTVTAAGLERRIEVIVRYRNGTRPQADTLSGRILC